MEQAITALDWQRMLIGDEPPLFLLEIVVRTLIIYIYTLALLRWLGSRTIGQLSTVEFLLVIALGSAVGDAMFYPDVPLIHALLVITLVVLANKALDILITRSKTAGRVIDGKPRSVIVDGAFCTEFLGSTSMGTIEIMQLLRERGVEHLGQVSRAYLESDGNLTAFLATEPSPGLAIVPPWEVEKPEVLTLEDPSPRNAVLACLRCGSTARARAGDRPGACHHCGHDHFTYARDRELYQAPGK